MITQEDVLVLHFPSNRIGKYQPTNEPIGYREFDGTQLINFRKSTPNGVEYTSILTKSDECIRYDNNADHAAKAFCRYYHDGQSRKYSKLPYYIHPYAVADLVAIYSTDIELYVAALLHDSVEDSECTIEEVNNYFNPSIGNLVWGCTNPSQVDDRYTGLRRKERKKIDLEWIIKNPKCHLIKAMDIYHNMFTSITADRIYYKTKVVPEKQEVLDNLIICNEARDLVQSSLDMVKSL